MKKLSLILIVVLSFILFNNSLIAQSVSNYDITWNQVEGAVAYKVFLWEGENQANSPFEDGQDYLFPDVSAYIITETGQTSYTIPLSNNGQYAQAAVVAENVHGLYSELGVSPFIVKTPRPNKPANIVIKRK